MPTYYETVGEEPTYELAEGIIKATIHDIKHDIAFLHNSPYGVGTIKYTFDNPAHNYLLKLPISKHKETIRAKQLIVKHFPEVFVTEDETVYVKYDNRHFLKANDLLIMDYYLMLFNEYEKRIKKYKQYLKKQENKQQLKLLFVLLLPFILFVLMILVGD